MPRTASLALGAATVFLALSDRVFGVRVGGMNVRFAQVVLVAMLIAAAWRLRRVRLSGAFPLPATAARLALALCVSFAVTAAFAAEPAPTLLRAGWFAFDFVGGLAFAAWAARRGVLAESVVAGVAAVAAVIWIDSIAIHWTDTLPWIGGAQRSFDFEGAATWRAHAFFHEPSFAAPALVLATALTLHPSAGSRRLRVLATALLVSAAFLTSSRTGVLALAVAGVAGAAALFRHAEGRRILGTAALSGLAAAAMIGAFSLDAGGRRYVRFVAGPLGAGAWDRLRDDRAGRESEADRMRSYAEGLAHWRESPWIGSGAARETDPRSGRFLAQGCISGWIGLLAEFGAIGAALHLALWIATWRGIVSWRTDGGRLVTAVLVAHFAVSLVLGPSFVRLDYCLLALAAMLACASPGAQQSPDAGDSSHADPPG